MKFVLRYDIRRVSCPKCQAVKVERVPWAETSSWFTVPFEDHVAYLAQRCDQTTVSAGMRIAWQTVGAIVQRVVARREIEQRRDPRAIPQDVLEVWSLCTRHRGDSVRDGQHALANAAISPSRPRS